MVNNDWLILSNGWSLVNHAWILANYGWPVIILSQLHDSGTEFSPSNLQPMLRLWLRCCCHSPLRWDTLRQKIEIDQHESLGGKSVFLEKKNRNSHNSPLSKKTPFFGLEIPLVFQGRHGSRSEARHGCPSGRPSQTPSTGLPRRCHCLPSCCDRFRLENQPGKPPGWWWDSWIGWKLNLGNPNQWWWSPQGFQLVDFPTNPVIRKTSESLAL